MKRRDAELMQKRRPPLSFGPSGKTWPRWLSPCAERTSVRVMPNCRSDFSLTLSDISGLVKLGQPEPESNLSSELKSGSPPAVATEMPAGGVVAKAARE